MDIPDHRADACKRAYMSKPNQVTIVYDIVDESAFQASGNPLNYAHHGLKAHTVAAYDAVERLQQADPDHYGFTPEIQALLKSKEKP